MHPEAYRYETVRQHLLDLLASGSLKPGDKAPSLRRLAARLRVSLSTASQAYATLESEGVLEAKPKSGFFVRPPRSSLPPPGAAPCPVRPPERLNRAGVIRAVLENISRRDMLALGVARTHESLLPLDRLARILGHVLRDEGQRAGLYSPVEGLEPLRRQIALRMMEAGAECLPGELVVTTGAMEALHIALRCVTRPGDTVAVAQPTYYCFLQLLENLGLRVVEVPSRPCVGVSPEDLEQVLDRYRVAACVLTPNFNNPDGSLIPDADKARIVELLTRRGTPLIEDDVYGDLHFGPERPRCCKAFDEHGLVLTCSSFSKTIAPGYRVGWLAPGRFLETALEIKATTSVSTATPTQLAIAEYLQNGAYHQHLKRLRPAAKAMMDTLHSLVGRHFPPGTRASRPQGGSVMWVQLPGDVDGVEYMRRALALGISVAPGAIFSSRDCFGGFVRLSASIPPGPGLETAIATLGRLVLDMTETPHAPGLSDPREHDPIAPSEPCPRKS